MLPIIKMVKLGYLLIKLSLLCFRIRIVKKKKLRARFRRLWQKAWLEEGYATENNILQITMRYAKYESHSIDFLLYFVNRPIGTLRLILANDEVGLPICNDFNIGKEWLGKKVLEITLFSVSPKFQSRNHLSALLLMRTFYRFAIQNNYDVALLSADHRLLRLLRSLGFKLTQIGQEKIYEGSITIPSYIDVQKTMQNIRLKNPTLSKFLDHNLKRPLR